jgi:hypothetical protein
MPRRTYYDPRYPYSRPPDTYAPDPIAAIARAEAEGRELTREQKDLAWKLITAAWDQSTEEE